MEGCDAPLGLRKGAWTSEEDILLREYILKNGEGNWHLIPKKAGINRCRKSCRLRWVNYLNPNIKRGTFEYDEIDLIIRLHNLLGNRWSLIAGRIPGRTSNDVKNYWNTHLKKDSKSKFTNKIANNSPMIIDIPNKVQPIRPRTHTFTKSLTFVKDKYVTLRTHDNMIHNMDCTINANITHQNQGNTTMLEPLYKDISNEEGDAHNLQQYPCLDSEIDQDGTDFFDQGIDWSDMLMLEDINIWSLLEDDEEVVVC